MKIYIFAHFFGVFVMSILANPLPAVELSEKSLRSENIGPRSTSSWGELSDTNPDPGQTFVPQDQIAAEGNNINWNNIFSPSASTSYDNQPTDFGSRQQLYAEGEPSPFQQEHGNSDCGGGSGTNDGAGKLKSREERGPGICGVQYGGAAAAGAVQAVPAPVIGDFSTTQDRLKKKSCASLLLYPTHACCAGVAAGKINNIYPFIDNCAPRKFSPPSPSPRCGEKKMGKVNMCGHFFPVFTVTGIGCLLDYEVCCERWAVSFVNKTAF